MKDNEVLTGFYGLDKRISGLMNSDLICIAARPAMGKTTFALNIVANVTKDKRPTVIFTLDFSKEVILNRIDKIIANDNKPFENLNIYDDILSIHKIEDVCRKLKVEDNIGLVVIDYLQLIKTDKQGLTTEQQIEDISKRLKKLAEELNIPIVVLSQLSKSLEEREDKRPVLGDFKISSSIVKYADTVIFIYRDEYYNKNSEHTHIVEVIVAKSRNGNIGIDKLADIDTRYANLVSSCEENREIRNEFLEEFNSIFGTQLKQSKQEHTMLMQLFHEFIEQSFQMNELYHSIIDKIVEIEDELQDNLTDEGKELFKKWETYRDELSNFESEQSFIYGYCLDKQLNIEKHTLSKLGGE